MRLRKSLVPTLREEPAEAEALSHNLMLRAGLARHLAQIWYQIQTKERDEARPRSGVLRTREFLMKDSYTLDPDLAALDRSYAAHESAYRKIFERCGLRFHVVQSDTGMMGGLGSHEFMAPSAAGEEFRAAHPDEVRGALGAPVGSVGPVGARVPILADESLKGGAYVVGANREGFHLRGVVPGRDFDARFVDLHTVQAGEACPQCGKPLAVERVIEIGNIFKLGTKYSVPLGATYLDESGQQKPIVMGSYGIGPARIAAAAVEQQADADGIVWPTAIAPYLVHIVAVNVKDQTQAQAAEALYAQCQEHGLEAVLDDRDERPGVKFKDADLLGMPVRVTIGNAFVKEGIVEVRARRSRAERKVPRDAAIAAIKELLAAS